MILANWPQNKILIAVSKEKSTRNDICAVSHCKESIKNVFSKKGIESEILFLEKSDFEGTRRLKKKILNINPFCVFNLFEGFSKDPQKEAVFVKLLESAKIPFTGNSSFALSACLDKIKVKRILKKNNLPVAHSILIKSLEYPVPRGLNFPLFIKPCREDGSCGIYQDSLVCNKEELSAAIKKRLKNFPEGVIAEEFLPGREYSVAFLGNNYYEPLGISEIDYSRYGGLPPFLTYDAKWEKKTLDYRVIVPDYEPKISRTLKKNIIDLSGKAGEALGCRSYFRVDLRESAGKFFIIDINPNPDINKDSGYIKLAFAKGYTYDAIIEKIVRLSNYH